MPAKKNASNNLMLLGALGACALLVVVAVVGTRLLTKEPPPPPPPPPPRLEQSVTGILRYKETYYKSTVEEDARKLQLPKPDLAALAAPMPYTADLMVPRKMKPDRDAFETAHLKLASRVSKEWATTATGGRYRFEHTILTITNKTDRMLAYRVATSVDHPEKCLSKGAIAHNAIALKPGERIERTECLWHPGATLQVDRIDIVEIPELSYYYVSRLVPSQVLLDERTATGHEAPKVKPCQFIPWRDIAAAAKDKRVDWADVIDFYARHNCDEYSYWAGYRRWTSPGSLPSKPPGKN